MGKTSTERSRLYRQKLKEVAEKYEQYKNKDKERKRAERSKPKKLSHSEIERRKRLNRERVRKCKLQKKAGSVLINSSDIQELIGNHVSPQQNWLSNFVIDNYLEIIKLACADKGVSVKTIKWEVFERGNIQTLAKEIEVSKLLNQEVILIPCNPIQSDHWYLMAVLPQRKLVIVLDSLAANILKPTIKARFEKMAEVLTTIDPNQQLDDWSFAYNSNEDNIPQQNNSYDCGVYTCMYARCLAGLGPMVDKSCFVEVRKHILLSLHRERLMEVPEDGIALEQYYAVHYEKKYYIGRVLSIPDSNHVQVKFLHNSRASKFDWPIRDDIDEVHLSSVFYMVQSS